MIDVFSAKSDFLIKAGETDGKRGHFEMVVSTEDRDLDGELVIQDGLQWDLFFKKGWFNYEHQDDLLKAIGEPTDGPIRFDYNGKPATKICGFMYLDDPLGAQVYGKAKMLAKSSSNRSLGGSIEGPVLERDPIDRTIVRRALVTNVAITGFGKSPSNELILKSATKMGFNVEALKKAYAGYQEPAQTEGGDAGVFSPLLSQSISSKMSIADFKVCVKGVFPRMSDHEMETLLKAFTTFPG